MEVLGSGSASTFDTSSWVLGHQGSQLLTEERPCRRWCLLSVRSSICPAKYKQNKKSRVALCGLPRRKDGTISEHVDECFQARSISQPSHVVIHSGFGEEEGVEAVLQLLTSLAPILASHHLNKARPAVTDDGLAKVVAVLYLLDNAGHHHLQHHHHDY